MNGMPRRGELRGVLQHRVAAVGRDDREAHVAARRAPAVSCADCIAPGWNAVIWLLSWSVMMIACAV